MKTLLRIAAVLSLVLAFAGHAEATTMSVSSQTIQNWQYTTTVGSGVVKLRLYVDRSFITSDGRPVLPGSPQGGAVYRTISCDLASDGVGGYTLTIPAFTLDSTTDAQDPNGKNARYSGWFYTPQNKQLAPYAGFESFRVLPLYSTSPTTWALIRADNTAGTPIPQDSRSYTDQQINRLIADAVSMSSGLTSIDGLTGPALTFVDHANITITPSGSTLTVGVTGQFAVGIGGTGSGTAAGARTNLGAAASGANSDITSLAGLTTPLSGPQGGTGFASYTVGDILYASSSSALSKLAGVATGQVLVSGGVATAPAWSASPTLTAVTTTNLTVSGLTTGRVPYVGASDQILDDSLFLFDAATDRLSVGVADSTNSINLANASYLSGRGSVAAAQVRIASISDSTRYTGAATSTAVDSILFGTGVPLAHSIADGGATPLLPLGVDFQVRTGGIRVLFGLAGAYNESSASNVFHSASHVTSLGTSPVVASFSQAVAMGAGSQAWAHNAVAYTDIGGASTAVAHLYEGNIGALGTSANQEAYGFLIAINAGATTPAGTVRSLLQFQRVTGASGLVGAISTNGIVFNAGGGQPVSNAPFYLAGVQSTYIMDATGGAFSTGLDFATSTFSSSSQIRLANGGAASSGLRAMNNANSASYNVGRMTTGDYIEYGDASAGLGGIRFLVSSTQDAMRILPGAGALPGNIGLNQATTSAQVHQTAVVKRALTGTAYSITNGTPNLTVTGGAFTTELAPGSSIEISAQAGSAYTVLSITDDDNLVLVENYTGSTTTTSTGKGDYRTWLIENGATVGSSAGDDWAYLDERHTMVLRGNSIYGDERGMLKLEARADSTKKLLFGVDTTGSYSYITSLQSFVGYMPLVLNGGAGLGDTGAVLIGTPTPSLVGASLKVEGAGAKVGNHVATEFNNIATSVNVFQKISAQYLTSGSWIGPNYGLFASATGAVSTTSSGTADRWNIPLGAYGGSVIISPAAAQVTSPAPISNVPTATLDVYAFAAENATDAADETAATSTSVNVAGTNTEWATVGNDDRIRPGEAVMFGSEGTVVYQVSSVTSNTALVLTGATAGSSGATEMYRDPDVLRLRNGFGTERLRLESSGFLKLTGTFVGNVATIGSATALPLGTGNIFVVTGSTAITSIAFDNAGLASDSSQAGLMITIVWDTGATFDVTDGAALQLAGGASITTFADGDTLTLLTVDGTNFVEVARSDN